MKHGDVLVYFNNSNPMEWKSLLVSRLLTSLMFSGCNLSTFALKYKDHKCLIYDHLFKHNYLFQQTHVLK